PVYETDSRGMGLVSLGLWLYDLLSLFRAPHFHKRLSRKQMVAEVPNLKHDGLVGGFTYYDASMWDDVMCVENARAAKALGSAVVSRVEAIAPIWGIEGEVAPDASPSPRIVGFRCRDRFVDREFEIRAHHTIVCGGPFTDRLGEMLLEAAPETEKKKFQDPDGNWKHWLKPSRGTHILFSKERLPVPGAMLLTNSEDGRISFVIP